MIGFFFRALRSKIALLRPLDSKIGETQSFFLGHINLRLVTYHLLSCLGVHRSKIASLRPSDLIFTSAKN